jgi:hypothetical protein
MYTSCRVVSVKCFSTQSSQCYSSSVVLEGVYVIYNAPALQSTLASAKISIQRADANDKFWGFTT